MKKKLSLAICAAMLLTTGAAVSETVSGNATAVIMADITITPVTTLNFGTIGSHPNAGKVSLNATNSSRQSVTHQFYGTATAGTFTIAAANSTALTITFTDGSISNGTDTFTVNNFSTSPSSVTTDAGGSASISVGADLNLTAAPSSGTYTGTYEITVNY